MNEHLSDSFLQHFTEVTDPRRQAGVRHLLIDMIFLTICAVIAGAEDWVAIERFGNAKIRWFSRFLTLKHGIPSHDRLGETFAALDPEQFANAFTNWVAEVSKVGGVIALDGKTVRRSYDKASGKAAIHMVSAWSVENRLVLGQVKVDDKSNEITAIPELLSILFIKGCLVTIDAMGCQTEISRQVIEQEGDYLLAVKGNQKHLHEDIVHLFKHSQDENFTESGFDQCRTVDKGHGRIEIRECSVISHPDWLEYIRNRQQWKALACVVRISAQRLGNGKPKGESRYYICSRSASASELLAATRAHWGVENNVHWILDVVFNEDGSRVRTGNAQQNLATIRRIAINMLNMERSRKDSLKGKRQQAGWDELYLEKVVFD